MTSQDTSPEWHRNLLMLIAWAGNAAELARMTELSPKYLRQLKNRTVGKGRLSARTIGPDAMRAIERAFGLPQGWIYFPHDLAQQHLLAASKPKPAEPPAPAVHRLDSPSSQYRALSADVSARIAALPPDALPALEMHILEFLDRYDARVSSKHVAVR